MIHTHRWTTTTTTWLQVRETSSQFVPNMVTVEPVHLSALIMRPSSLEGGRILRRTLSVCLSVRPVIVFVYLFRLDALALSIIATATWLGGWVGGCLSQPVLYQND